MSALPGGTMPQFPSGVAETLLVTIILCIALFLMPRRSEKVFHIAAGLLSRFAERRTLAVWVLFFSVVGIRLSVLPLLPVPVPGIHDEYSYLLMGDTFAHGRLTNPTHPMWKSFETFHVNWLPSYSSMYPPAQGFVLALGQWLGRPWIGVLLSDAAMCAVVLWMLQAWMPARWALLGGVLVALKLGIASYWMNSYWGGAVAAIGAALVLGALARILRRARVRDALLLGGGVAILANSRPYEGLLFCLPAAGWFLWWLLGKTRARVPARTRVTKALAPLGTILALSLALMGYYDWRLTGNALLLPHVLNTQTYHSAGLFLWDHAREPLEYRNRQFEEFYSGWERENYQNTWSDAWRVSMEKVTRYGSTYFWWGELLLLPGLPFVFRDRKMRLPLIILLIGTAGAFAVIWSNPHYVAPMTCVIFAVAVQSIRHLRTMRVAGHRAGLALSGTALLLLFADVSLGVSRRMCDPMAWTCEGDPSRAAIVENLSRIPGKHLVVVRYSEDHNIHDEWVFNGAEIDGAKILWARELDPRQNVRLFAYFHDRQIWLVEPDRDNTNLIPYPKSVAEREH
jgi:hypothetical protein